MLFYYNNYIIHNKSITKNCILKGMCVSEDDSEDESEFKRYVTRPKAIKKFTGHRNARTMMKEATWWGNNFVLSGSDCGHIFGWERSTEELVFLQVSDFGIKTLIYAIF